MSRLLSFDNLPNEIIISIFEYLKVAENFHAFFNLNSRLRKLVKQYVWFSRSELRNDIELFSQLQCWYKNLNFIDDGQIFYLIPFHNNSNDIHWQISKQKSFSLFNQQIDEIIEKYSIRLNPLFHPFGQIFSSGFQYFINRHYPIQFNHLKNILFNTFDDRNHFQLNQYITENVCIHLDFIFENERKRLIKTILTAAYHIWRDLQKIEDLNILNIKQINQ